MHTFLHRYELDTSAPTRKEAWRDFAERVLLPAVGLWVVIVGVGLLITGPLEQPARRGRGQRVVRRAAHRDPRTR